MDSSKLKLFTITFLSMILAVYLGVNAATAQVETVLWVLGSITFIVCFLLGRSIWLLIPFTAAIVIVLRIPGQPDSLLIGQLLFLAFCTPLFLLRKLPCRTRFTELEWLMLLLSILVLQVYVRNPVGLNLVGSDSVGGKAYVIYVISLVASFILCGYRVKESDLKWMRHLIIAGGVLNLLVSIVGILIPTIGFYTGVNSSRVGEVNYENASQVVDAGAANRKPYLRTFGENLVIWVCSFRSPLHSLTHPFWLIILAVASVCCMLSGYRSSVIAAGGMFMIAVFYRNGISGLLASFMAATVGLVMLAGLNTVFKLPPNIQRSLSFLPGSWESRYVRDGEDSTDWRVEIWKEVLLTDRWIQNKWFGDGLGFTMKELQYQINLSGNTARKGYSGFDQHRESILASGDYHSGPVQTIRVIGYVGLIVLVLFQVRLAILAHHQIRRSMGTEWLSLTMMICIPIIWAPFQFCFIFGTFKDGAAALLLGSGMIRILQNNLPLPSYQDMFRKSRHVPVAHKGRLDTPVVKA